MSKRADNETTQNDRYHYAEQHFQKYLCDLSLPSFIFKNVYGTLKQDLTLLINFGALANYMQETRRFYLERTERSNNILRQQNRKTEKFLKMYLILQKCMCLMKMHNQPM